MPDAVWHIDRNAFRDCLNLKYVSIPQHTMLQENAFKGCHPELTLFVHPDSEGCRYALKNHIRFELVVNHTAEQTSPRLTIRPLAASDLATTHAYAGNLENTRFMMFLPYADEAETASALAEAEALWRMEQPERYEFAICLEGQHIGGITLYMQENRTEAELGWVLHRDYWRCGYVTEAAKTVMDFARGNGVQRIFACCDSENVASRKTMEKLGMKLVKDDGVRTNRSMGAELRVELTYEICW